MQEIELKFQIPVTALSAVRADLAQLPGGAEAPLLLKAAYFDTPERALAGARMALRVRQEGKQWIQTLKAGGSNTMMRLEDNHPACPPRRGQVIQAELSLHLGTPAETPLQRALNWSPQKDPTGACTGLIELYRTDIKRTRARLTVGRGTPFEGEVELALDLGHIHAGELSVPVRELEIESLSGHPMAVITAAREWMHRHGLWLDVQTKAHRGDRLARRAAGQDDASVHERQAVVGRPARIQPDCSLDQGWRAALESCLEHISGNMSELATGPQDITVASYQWRLGLRRLWALGRLLADSGVPFPQTAMESAARLSRRVGDWRNAQTLAWVPGKTAALGGPAMPLPCPDAKAAQARTMVALARSADASDVCLDLLAALLSPPLQGAGADTVLRPWLVKRLRHWHRRCLRSVRQVGDLNDDELHALRKRGKRLRLMAALFAPLWKEKRQQTHERALKSALDALGRLQDEAVAESWYRQAAEHDPRALFAQGWLLGRRRHRRAQARRALRRWARVKTPW